MYCVNVCKLSLLIVKVHSIYLLSRRMSPLIDKHGYYLRAAIISNRGRVVRYTICEDYNNDTNYLQQLSCYYNFAREINDLDALWWAAAREYGYTPWYR